MLLGTIEDGPKSVAVFSVDNATSITTRLGGNILGFSVSDIARRGVTLRRGDHVLFVRPGENLDGTEAIKITTGIERTGDKLKVTTALRDYVTKDGLVAVLNQAASEPVTENGEQVGYKIVDIDKGSAFDLAGLQDNDVVKEVDGVALTNPITALRVLMRVKEAENFTFKFARGAVERTITVEVF